MFPVYIMSENVWRTRVSVDKKDRSIVDVGLTERNW